MLQTYSALRKFGPHVQPFLKCERLGRDDAVHIKIEDFMDSKTASMRTV